MEYSVPSCALNLNFVIASSLSFLSMIDKNDIANYVKRFTFVSNDGAVHSLFDLVWPIGITYVQYPQQASPMDLWGAFSTWEVVYYDGAFFRAEGGNAGAFIEKSGDLVKQQDQNKSHSHSASGMNQNSQGSFQIYDGACIGDISGFVKERIGITWYRGKHNQRSFAGVSMDISHTHTINPDGGNEARPANYTMRIWVRTA